MREEFQRLLVMRDAGPAVLSLNVQAAQGPVREPERSQWSHLVRHFLERFFNSESASQDTDGKTRLVQLAAAAGLPGFMVAIYLWPIYHPIQIGAPGSKVALGPPPYWVQMNHHFFFVLYSFVAMGLITVFEWDLFFPDLLDVFVLGTLPVPSRRIFQARVAAIAVFIVGFLFDANLLAPIVLPMATDPPNIVRMLAGHVAAVACSGLFAAIFVVAAQSVLLALFGERSFRRISLLLQGCAVTVLVMLLLLFPVLSGVTPALLQAGSGPALWFPPFWFLGMYQRILDGPASLPVFHQLTNIGLVALLAASAVTLLAYPIAYLRRTKQLLEGLPPRAGRSQMARPLNWMLHTAIVRAPIRRAVFHFINQTIFRIPRYRIYLVLYGGVGLSVVIATVLRLSMTHQQLRAGASADGIRVAVGIVAFWVIAGLRTAFVSSGNQQGSWVFRIVHGKPAHFNAALMQLRAAQLWAMLWTAAITVGSVFVMRTISPAELLTWPATAAQLLVAAGASVILTDAFFSGLMTVPFTGEPAREQPNLAFTVLRYYVFFLIVPFVSIGSELWIEKSWLHFGLAAIIVTVVHLWFRLRHRNAVRVSSAQAELEEGEEDFPMKLGLRY